MEEGKFSSPKKKSRNYIKNLASSVLLLHTVTKNTVKQLTGGSDISNPLKISEAMKTLFVQQWNKERKLNRKLGFYNLIKASFGCETYLSINLRPQQTRRLAQLRTSSHQYNIETGRHGMHRHKLSNRACKHCSTTDVESRVT